MHDSAIDDDGDLAASYELGRALSPAGLRTWRAAVHGLVPSSGRVVDAGDGTGRFPTARAVVEARMPAASDVRQAFKAAGLRFVQRSVHQMHTADNLTALADRLSHRAISTLRLISDDEFHVGLDVLRKTAHDADDQPVMSPNVLLVFERRP